MKNNTKKILAALLAALTVLPLVACSNTSDVGTSDTTSASADTTTVETADPTKPELPEDLDFEGASFTVFTYESTKAIDIRLAESENGDSLNDAAYQASRDVEEKLNVDFAMLAKNLREVHPSLSQSVLAGDGAYQLVVPHCMAGVPAMVQEKLILDWNDLPYVDFDKPYWNQQAIEELSIAGKTPYTIGDYITADPAAIMFNKDMSNDMNLPNTYDLVRDGTWTWDKLTEIASGVSADVNGDGKMDKEDRYGFVAMLEYQFNGILQACGQRVVEKDANGAPKIVINNEKTVDIINKIYNLVYDSGATFTHRNIQNPVEGFDFATGRALYYVYDVSNMSHYRDCEVEFGIVPYPKFDEAQDGYYSLTLDALMCAPIDADAELVGAVTELLNYKYRDYVYPAYYDIMLSGKVSRDEESSEMLDLIFDGVVYDFGLNYSDFGKAAYLVFWMMYEKKTDVASYYEANIRKEEQHYVELYEAITND